ncbi:hypothetical protein TeGR_g15102, partial [Tetraparma gracilis]
MKNVLGCKEFSFNGTLTTSAQNNASLAATPPATISLVKSALLSALADESDAARSTSSQCIAELARLLIPDSWPELLPALLSNVTSPTLPDAVKVSTLSCLGYTAEALQDKELPQELTNLILTAIVDGLAATKDGSPVADPIRLSAATALRNSLLFCAGNMSRKAERDVIFQRVCEATQSATSGGLRRAAYECVVEVAERYYHHLKDYMQ